MKIEVLAGEWKSATVNSKELLLLTADGKMERHASLKTLEEATEEKKSQWKKKIGVGFAVGVLTFGVGGVIAGLLVGNKKYIEFFCELTDGRAFCGRIESKGFYMLHQLVKNNDAK